MGSNRKVHIGITIIICCLVAVVLGFGVFYFAMLKYAYIGNEKAVISAATQKLDSTHNLSPFISNQWYSSIFSSFPSAPLYAFPLAFQLSPQGLGFSYPTVTASSSIISASYRQDFTIGFVTESKKPTVTNIGDWSIQVSMEDMQNNSMSYVLAHGLPSTVITTNSPRLSVNFNANPDIEAVDKGIIKKNFKADSFIATVHNNTYIFVLPAKTPVQLSNNRLLIDYPNRMYVGLLDKKDHAQLFKDNANVDITDTQAEPQISANSVSVMYQFISQNGSPLITLLPHQYDTLTTQQNVLGTYQTLRGELKLIKANTFTTSTPLLSPSGTFSKLTQDHPDLIKQIKQDINGIIKGNVPDSHDYYLGKWFGKISTLLLLSDTFGLKDEKERLLEYVEPVFLKSLDNFSYDSQKTSIIAKYPEFGNENLNDHHFHYGYYIRTAAVLTSFDLQYLPKVQEKIYAMVRDVATIHRDDSEYPYLRTFDIYEGHSWADGLGNTNDGNNQESSSEAINCWYGIYLWSKVVNDLNFQKYAIYLYNSEIQSAMYYWFNSKDIYPHIYSHALASLVWGGKAGFETWFSNDATMKYGIQLLPFTPASAYLGSFQNFQKYFQDYTTVNPDFTKPWSDLFLMWYSFYQPAAADNLKNSITSFEDGNSKSAFLYFLDQNKENVRLK